MKMCWKHLALFLICLSTLHNVCAVYSERNCTNLDYGIWTPRNTCIVLNPTVSTINRNLDPFGVCKMWAGPSFTSHLAHSLDPDTNANLQKLMNNSNVQQALIGAQFLLSNQTWNWMFDQGDQSIRYAVSLSWTPAGFATSNSANLTCLAISSSNGNWAPAACSMTNILCEKYDNIYPNAMCPIGWVQQGTNCFLYTGLATKFVDANDYCNRRFAHLPTIKNDDDWTNFNTYRHTLSNYNYSNYDDNVWLSANVLYGITFQWHDRTDASNSSYNHWFVSKVNGSIPEPSPVGCRECCPWMYCDVPGACSVSLGTYDEYHGDWATTSCDSALFQTICVRPDSMHCVEFGVNKGTVHYTDRNLTAGVNASVSCAGNYSVSNPPSATCLNGQWSSVLTCDGDCSGIPDAYTMNVTFTPPVNGANAPDNGAKVSVKCQNQSKLFREISEAQCVSGEWAPSIPACVYHCQKIPPVGNGTIIYEDPTSWSMDSKATLVCNNGYYINGTYGQPNKQITNYCKMDGTWNLPTFPDCQSMCDFEPCLNNGTCGVNSTGFYCTCIPPYNGTYCEMFYGPCIDFFAVQSTSGRKKRQIPLDPFSKIIANTLVAVGGVLNTTVNTVVNIVGNTLNGVLTGNVTNLLGNILNPLVGLLGSLLNDLLVNLIVKGLLTPLITSILPNQTINHCISVLYTSCREYTTCNKSGYQSLITDGKVCDPASSLPLLANCTYVSFEKPSFLPNITSFLSPTEQLVVAVVKTSSCAIFLGLVGGTFLLFIALRVFTIERLPQMCQEIALFVIHIFVILMDSAVKDTTFCTITSVVMQFMMIANFVFMILESLQAYCVLQNVISSGGYYGRMKILIIGWGVPAIITAVMTVFFYEHYPSEYSCWLNIDNMPVQLGTVLPIVVATAFIMIITEASTFQDLKRLPLTPEIKINAALITQKGLGIILVLNILSWVAGMYSVFNPRYISVYATASLLNILLAVAICVFHIAGNDTVTLTVF